MTARAGYRLSFAAEDIDARAAHAFLGGAYWCEGIPLGVVERAIANSLCIALHAEKQGQVGFARVVTDRATFAYLCDVYVLEAHRGRVWAPGSFRRGSAEWLQHLRLPDDGRFDPPKIRTPITGPVHGHQPGVVDKGRIPKKFIKKRQ